MILNWKTIPGLPGYEASSSGQIRYQNKILNQWNRVRGYLGVRVNEKNMLVSRLVAIAFHGMPPDRKPECMHLDSIRKNNAASNLRWGSRSENMKMDIGNNHSHKGSSNKNSKITKSAVIAIRNAFKNKNGYHWGVKELAKKYKISPGHCSKIARRYHGGWRDSL